MWSGTDKPRGVASRELARRAQLRVTGVYFAVGVVWIAASDSLLALLAGSKAELAQLQTFKGWLYVAVTTGLLFVLVRRSVRYQAALHQELEEQHRRLATLFANLPGMAYRRAPGGGQDLLFASAGSSNLFAAPSGVPPPGAPFLEHVHPEDRAEVARAVTRAAELAQPFSISYRLGGEGARTRWVWDQGRPVTPLHGGGALVIEGYLSDVSELKSMEARLRQAERMESLGRMAGSIAHDFNNVLFAISGGCELLLQRKLPEDAHREVELVRDAGASAARLVASLLEFARKKERRPVKLDMNRVIDDSAPILRRVCGARVSLTLTLAPDLPPVCADATQLEQVIMNLVKNAADASARPGDVRIATDVVVLRGAEAAQAELPEGEFVRLTVTDHGSGIEPAVLPHIFDPFFTTKGPEQGTGLGLATVYGLVRQSGGGVVVRTRLGQGTSLEVLLPRLFAPCTEGP